MSSTDRSSVMQMSSEEMEAYVRAFEKLAHQTPDFAANVQCVLADIAAPVVAQYGASSWETLMNQIISSECQALAEAVGGKADEYLQGGQAELATGAQLFAICMRAQAKEAPLANILAEMISRSLLSTRN